ncbi:phosphate acyltransferase PlsX [Candidatus Magnetaquicoccus inordinatus]|uniref:phosphate acyltransferase PlsX n=1 Tax=Candidatus Magnetaquicoccus inordinatus TaxID=2496818 RepID=UPI001D0E203B|nr:phosphate acyltransferase PlsX [Candidatus Magnetaquicoccus inordinatus]
MSTTLHSPIRIALDAMGGDHAPHSVLEGAMRAKKAGSQAEFTLVGREDVIQLELQKIGADPADFRIQPASQVVGMGEKPAQAMRSKKDSSLRVGANLVKEGKVDAFVSSGNTGALMATARFVLKTLPGIDRPAIASLMPSISGQVLMLDLGANVDCTAEHLCQFALMGEVYAHAVLNIHNPKVGLLNIGSEEEKGNEVVKEAGERLKTITPCFVGNVEATGVFQGKVDVVVCDGFVGNVSLKTAEGVASMLVHFLRESFNHSWLAKLGYLLARTAFRRFRDRFDPRVYNGAMLLGLNGVVVKSHGSADGFAFYHAIKAAEELVANRVNEKTQVIALKMQTMTSSTSGASAPSLPEIQENNG